MEENEFQDRLQRVQSRVSRVEVDYFDHSGVQELRRTLPQQGHAQRVECSSDGSADTLGEGKDSFNFEQLLRDTVQKRHDAQIRCRKLGVIFRDLKIVGVGAASSYQPTMGSMFSASAILEYIHSMRHPPLKNILQGFEGVVKPGEMLLVLGSPGSGCTTFLKTLANQHDEYHAVDGQVMYDSITPKDMKDHFRGDVQYCPEDDVHFPTLTVEQTISFAAKTRAPKTRVAASRDEQIQTETDILMTVFGLKHVRNTMVGDAAIRGVSGGQKKRVSIAETLAARSCINAWDNSTRGLDASTALEFVRALRIATDVFRTTTIVSLYQAGESLYQHFDKVCVIYEGRMAYFGPADQAKQYFIDMGYEPANRQTTPDFLVAVTDPNARIPRTGIFSIPRTAEEFEDYFKKSNAGRANREEIKFYEAEFVGKPELAAAYIESARAEYAKGANRLSPYITSIPMQTRAVMLRRIHIMWGNLLATLFNFFSFIIQAVIVGSVFFNSEEATSAYFSRGSVIFFSLLLTALAAMAEIPALYGQRPIVIRHEKAAFYHPFVEALALSLVDIPITLVTMLAFSVILYFMVGLRASADHFFIFLLFINVMAFAVKSWFRGISAAVPYEPVAQIVAGISILIVCMYTGFTIPRSYMIGALRWISYINPTRYIFEAMLTNEFRDLHGICSSLIPQGPGYENVSIENQVCAVVGALPGEIFVDGNRFTGSSYGFSFDNTWRNLGIAIAFCIGFFILMLILFGYNTTIPRSSPIVLFNRGAKRRTSSRGSDEEALSKEKPSVLSSATGTNTVATSIANERQTDIFSWQHVNYTVPDSSGQERKLLDDVSGFVAPGKLTALMGESGAGKTTLLNVLAERVDVGVVTGDRFVNGQALPADFQAQTGYCQQTDTHVPSATVREALLFSAKLRQPKHVPLVEKEAWVEKCIYMCGLGEWAEASIGSLGVEQRKRTTIAVELAAKPRLLLFLDEPTSGLDSQSAWAIVSFLRSLANSGQAILCTIHQPSAELFQVFDRLLLLRKGGQTVYFGDIGHNAQSLIDYFERNGGRKCLPAENPAEYMLDVIGAGATATSSLDWYKIWQNSPEAQILQRDIESIHIEGRKRPAAEAAFTSEFATPWIVQLKELLIRDAQAHWRDPVYLVAKMMLNIIGGLFIGFAFWKSADTLQGTQNKLFAVFMAAIMSYPLANQLQAPFISMRSVYEIRERQSKMYNCTALVLAQILVEIPWNIVGSTLMFFCWYWTVGFDSSRAGYTYLMLGVMFPLYYTTIGQAIAAMSPTTEIAAILFYFLFAFVIIFNGVLQPFSQLGWWQWMYRLSPFTYLIEGLLGQVIGHSEISCSPIEFVTINPPSGQTCSQYMGPWMSHAGGYLSNPNATSDCQFCGMRSADMFLGQSFNIFYDHRWRNIGLMAAFTAFNIAAIYGLTYVLRVRKGDILPFKKVWGNWMPSH
ncbi:hypothetical protein AX16_010550 [Volvariella volvacea WC 439]|nr:hypothetical protein AX16_010550 [Volvariella volvacea WC 439]